VDRHSLSTNKHSPLLFDLGREMATLVSGGNDDLFLSLKLRNCVANDCEKLLDLLDDCVCIENNGHLQMLQMGILMVLEMFMIACIPDVENAYVRDTPPRFHWIIAEIKSTVLELLSTDYTMLRVNPLLDAANKICSMVTSALSPPENLHLLCPFQPKPIPLAIKEFFEARAIKTRIPLL